MLKIIFGIIASFTLVSAAQAEKRDVPETNTYEKQMPKKEAKQKKPVKTGSKKSNVSSGQRENTPPGPDEDSRLLKTAEPPKTEDK
ncbi:hypothetical protein B9G69_014615 [Bdellovibrio sp. SKB1291214]|uniref:hypothetical protein n=1 Tax=Bdellovibrio sp. SKB1291214 TaxID=1732569 RepID=UPI000B5158BA|nr:hypothetical protein [Bdellovibrio sp. SKB1291214]UYL08274.1 hypothetical protein B9G69_014615 [Bdellovibrio sp. SKB1291214]